MSYPVYYVEEGDTLPVLFDSFDGGTGASITLTGLAVTDIEIYKDGGTTQRSSDAGYTLLDTDGIDFDTITGIHGFSINLSDNTDAGFYAVGPWYHVVISSVTVDAQTVNFIACAFRILSATRGMAGTALPAVAAEAAGGLYTRGSGAGQINQAANGQIDTNTVAMASGVVTATAIAADAIGASELAADAVGEIADAVWDEATAGHAGAGSYGLAVSDILTDTGTTLQAEVDGIQADTEDIQARLPAALSGGRMDSITNAMAAGVVSASALAADAVDEILDDTIGDGTITVRQALRVLLAGMAGKLSGAATTTVTIRNTADSADVIVATVDADGNRSAVTVTP